MSSATCLSLHLYQHSKISNSPILVPENEIVILVRCGCGVFGGECIVTC